MRLLGIVSGLMVLLRVDVAQAQDRRARHYGVVVDESGGGVPAPS